MNMFVQVPSSPLGMFVTYPLLVGHVWALTSLPLLGMFGHGPSSLVHVLALTPPPLNMFGHVSPPVEHVCARTPIWHVLAHTPLGMLEYVPTTFGHVLPHT